MPKPFIVSDESINCYGFKLKSTGGKFEQFLKNPIMLYDHNDKLLPIGTWTDLKVHSNGTITAIPVFDEDDEFALSVKKKVDKGIIKMSSVSVQPIEIEGDLVTEWELREISITPFGGNKNAFRLFDNSGNAIDLSNKEGLLKLKEQIKITNLNNNNQMSDKGTLKVMLAASLNLSDTISDSEILRTVLKLSQENIELKQKVTAAEKKEKETKEAIDLKDKNTLLDLAVQQKKITLSQKAVYAKMELDDIKVALGEIKPTVDLSAIPGGNGGATESPWDKRMEEIQSK